LYAVKFTNQEDDEEDDYYWYESDYD
jgi:hypothetical protein